MTARRSISVLKRAALALLLLPLMAARTSPHHPALAPAPAPAPAAQAQVQLWRLDCGNFRIGDLDSFSDTRAYVGQSRELVGSCYLIKHGDAYMLWDTGLARSELGKALPATGTGSTLRISIVDQLKQIGVKPEQVVAVGISHYHYDHTGQAADFPGARLLMGRGDLEAVRADPAHLGAPFAPWIVGKGTAEAVAGDRDVFGDRRVIMLDLPGHTPGHHGLLVKLDHTGWVLISGDAAHFHENLDSDGVPSFNTDRANTLASLDRFKKIGANLKAVVILQHDPRDVSKLPAFPAAAD
jgi:glyoxylase-like metal-dependent hydrolase (beta-lactamase superfamily II)